ncbi:MAG: glutathione S-transferase N-terminal domain-containing protein, partial [Pirellulaceae bacterium]|nr:glutathione S-transferase N-terminal domain-containing protein [Pirellulaceae bacterium]
MVLVEPTNLAMLDFKGLHLYHAHISNCSARVRLLLEEKKLPWESHHIILAKRQNITEEYFGINPKGVVPSLVHDGKVITES